jgi:hypothetical protein
LQMIPDRARYLCSEKPQCRSIPTMELWQCDFPRAFYRSINLLTVATYGTVTSHGCLRVGDSKHYSSWLDRLSRRHARSSNTASTPPCVFRWITTDRQYFTQSISVMRTVGECERCHNEESPLLQLTKLVGRAKVQ